ncbi:MAG: HAMP domain-containing sensor histidine kinase [Dysgonomonas sp.]|uniref:sensor histidine kinase n=1 Tax=Dysgonomonas sp. TaxID=1891233 RepID=UPI0039E3F848
MRLFHVIRKYLLLTLFSIMILGGVSIFFIFKIFIHQSTDQILYEYKTRIENYVALNDTMIEFTTSVIQPQRVEQRIINPTDNYPLGIKDTLLYNENSGAFLPYRQLYFTIEYKNRLHLVNVNQQTFEFGDLLYVLIGSILALFLLFFVFTYLVDFYLKKKVWSPFNDTLEKLDDYDLEIGRNLSLTNSGIKEFDKLNEVVNKMVGKINSDYENTKNFSEDISHEMQTPLAIIKSRIDIIRQQHTLDKDSIVSLSVISNAVSRLSNLNKSLLLLTKIRNDQFQDIVKVNVKQVITDFLENIEELIDAKAITVNIACDDLFIDMDLTLSDILISNLLVNAIRHNTNEGFVKIQLSDDKLIIENSCLPQENKGNLFDRMVSNKSKDSIGLGLNLVKSICDKNGFDVSYSFPMDRVFRIEIIFYKH